MDDALHKLEWKISSDPQIAVKMIDLSTSLQEVNITLRQILAHYGWTQEMLHGGTVPIHPVDIRLLPDEILTKFAYQVRHLDPVVESCDPLSLLGQHVRALDQIALAEKSLSIWERLRTVETTQSAIFDGKLFKINDPIAFRLFHELVKAHNLRATPISRKLLAEKANYPSDDPRIKKKLEENLDPELFALIDFPLGRKGGLAIKLPS